jgi:transcriptional regulator of acetoin/glycerol metabolism
LAGLDPDRIRIGHSLGLEEENGELTQAAKLVIQAAASTLDDTNTWISFADINGVVTYQWAANEQFRRKLDKAGIAEGAVINEPSVGPSGIAIALSANQPVIVSGDEHFSTNWRDLVCAASPIVRPFTNELVGAVNITCPADEQNNQLRIALKTVVSGFNHILSSSIKNQRRQLLDAHASAKSATGSPIITVDDDTMIVDAEVELFRFSHQEIRETLRSLPAHVRKTRLPSGDIVEVLSHVDRGVQIFSLVFDRDHVGPGGTGVGGTSRTRELTLLEQAERDTIARVLTAVEGNRSIAAERLGISRGTLYERLRRYELG